MAGIVGQDGQNRAVFIGDSTNQQGIVGGGVGIESANVAVGLRIRKIAVAGQIAAACRPCQYGRTSGTQGLLDRFLELLADLPDVRREQIRAGFLAGGPGRSGMGMGQGDHDPSSVELQFLNQRPANRPFIFSTAIPAQIEGYQYTRSAIRLVLNRQHGSRQRPMDSLGHVMTGRPPVPRINPHRRRNVPPGQPDQTAECGFADTPQWTVGHNHSLLS